jgi:O-acetyl-ADP-ribose deacetylase (regulator of RNase III)
VAGISGLWQASEYSIRHSVRSAVALAEQQGFKSLAFPIIGAGTGSFSQSKALSLMLDELSKMDGNLQTIIVQYVKPSAA